MSEALTDLLAFTAAEKTAERSERRMRAQIDGLEAEVKELRTLLGLYESSRHVPIQVPRWQMRQKKGGHAGLVIAQCADWHLDEVVKADEVLGINAYDRKIARQRVRRWTDKVVTVPRDYMAGIRIDGLIVLATGDLFTGEIHAELKESNEKRLLESFLDWQEPVIAALETFEREYPSVAVYSVVGNHGRLSPKPIFKGRVYDNVEWLFWSIIRDRLADRGSKVVINVSTSMDLNVAIYGRNHLLTHGDQFRGGSGISGAFAPLSLGSHRKGKRQTAAGLPMETMVIGHMHQLINIPGVVMGGCLKGYDEYAFGLNFPPAEAAQAMWVTTPERAQVNWMPVYVQDRKAEGW